MAEKKQTKKVVKKRGISICSGCIEEYKNTELFLVPGANHGESFALIGDKYKQEIDSFLERYIQ